MVDESHSKLIHNAIHPNSCPSRRLMIRMKSFNNKYVQAIQSLGSTMYTAFDSGLDRLAVTANGSQPHHH